MKARVTLTAHLEYEIKPENYPEATRDSPQKMLEIDLKFYENDLFVLLEQAQETDVTAVVLK